MPLPADKCPNRIRYWRQKRGLSLQHVADAIGTSRMQLSRLETGNREETVSWLRKVGVVLGVGVADLLHSNDAPIVLDAYERELIINLRQGRSPEGSD